MFKRKQKSEQKTFCYCPACKGDLCSNGSFAGDDMYVHYDCTVCGTSSDWDFDAAPVPLLIRHSERVLPQGTTAILSEAGAVTLSLNRMEDK